MGATPTCADCDSDLLRGSALAGQLRLRQVCLSCAWLADADSAPLWVDTLGEVSGRCRY